MVEETHLYIGFSLFHMVGSSYFVFYNGFHIIFNRGDLDGRKRNKTYNSF